MFYIEDGREHFYQWDTDRRLVVEDETITEVHFCNRTDNCSLVCEVYSHDNDFGGIRVVNVPNILLQTDWKIHVYAYDGKHTKHDECYEVKSRTKPTDYVYTETEVVVWEAFEKRVDEKIEEIEQTANNAQAISSEAKVNSDIADAKANSAIEDAESALAIARGANQALTFNDYNECCSWVIDNNITPNISYPIGNVILIKTLYVPDLYIYGDAEEYTEAIPTNDEILSMLETDGFFDIGYCRLAQLETQKVDLSDYAKKAQVPTITTTLKDNGAYTLTITKGVE